MTDPSELLEAEPEHEKIEGVGRAPFCEHCTERGQRLAHVAAGHGTVSEIREALNQLENVRRSGAPLGEKVVVDRLRICPRCTPAKAFGLSDDPTVPLISVVDFSNRRTRRRHLRALRRRRG
jgi:hypothetical protein